jgi:hypothetical protein
MVALSAPRATVSTDWKAFGGGDLDHPTPGPEAAVVCNPRKNALLKHGNKSDRIDARKLAEGKFFAEIEAEVHG